MCVAKVKRPRGPTYIGGQRRSTLFPPQGDGMHDGRDGEAVIAFPGGVFPGPSGLVPSEMPPGEMRMNVSISTACINQSLSLLGHETLAERFVRSHRYKFKCILPVVTNAIELQLDQLGMGANVYLTYPITEFFLLVVSSHDQNSASSLDVFVDSVHFR